MKIKKKKLKMPNLTEITQFCRLCLVKNNVNIPIFEDQSENGQIFVKISSCLPVTVTRDDDLPKNICSECANKLDVAYEFRKSTVVAEKQLRQWIDDINIKNLNDSSKEADDNQIIKEEPDDSFVAIPETITYESDKGSSSKTRKSGGSEPPPKRARRAAAMKRPVNIPSESDEDVDDVEPLLTKTEDSDSELDTEDHDPTFEDIPPTNVDQPGPSGVGKEGVECLPDFFMPIVQINENPKKSSQQKNNATVQNTKNLKSIEKIAKKRKRGRPKKDEDNVKKRKAKEEFANGCKEQDNSEELNNINEPMKLKSVKKNRVDDTTTYSCPICKDDVKRTMKELRKHYRDDHQGKRLRWSRISSEMHPCDICGKQFKTSASLKDHMETHNNYFECSDCGANYKKLIEYMIHLRTHSLEGIFNCLMCDFITTEIIEFTNHVNNNHEDTHKYWCDSCKKGFHILTWFQEHDNFHTGLKPFSCNECGKSFLYSRYLSAHKNYLHKDDLGMGPNFHICVICKKQYQHKNSLKLHMNSHTGNYAICDVCGKILSSKEKLKFHMRIHTGYKPFKCQYCEKSFTKKPILVEHIRIHTGERPYVCEYCTKAFSQRSSLVIHIRSHTGERPYKCQFCTKGFVSRAMLNIHFKACKGF